MPRPDRAESEIDVVSERAVRPPAGFEAVECRLLRHPRVGLGLIVNDDNLIINVDPDCSAAGILRAGDKIVSLNGEWLQGPIVTALDPSRTSEVVIIHRKTASAHAPDRDGNGASPLYPPVLLSEKAAGKRPAKQAPRPSDEGDSRAAVALHMQAFDAAAAAEAAEAAAGGDMGWTLALQVAEAAEAAEAAAEAEAAEAVRRTSDSSALAQDEALHAGLRDMQVAADADAARWLGWDADPISGERLYWAAARGDDLQPLLDAGSPVNWQMPAGKRGSAKEKASTPLAIASKKGHVDAARQLLHAGAAVRAIDIVRAGSVFQYSRLCDALVIAAAAGQVACVEELLNASDSRPGEALRALRARRGFRLSQRGQVGQCLALLRAAVEGETASAPDGAQSQATPPLPQSTPQPAAPQPQPQPQGTQQSHFFATVPPDAVAGQQLSVAAPNGTSVWFRSLPADFFPNARVQVAHDPASAPGAVQLVPDPDVVRSLEAMGFPAEHAARAALHEFGTEACVAWILRELQG